MKIIGVSSDYLSVYHAVDTFDQNAMEFRSKHRCKRWYIPLFWSLFNFAILNAWTIRKNIQKKSGILKSKVQSQKEFIKVI